MKRLAVAMVLASCIAVPAWAHEGEKHAAAPGTESAPSVSEGLIEVSDLAQKNLGLEVADAELRPVESTVRAVGEVVADPRLSASVSSRIAGRVTAVFAQEGERVAKGATLVEVESLQLGDPPPRARYASPLSGTIIDRHVVVGDEVEPNRHLLEVADLSAVLALGRVFEGQIGRIAIGQAVRVRVPSFPQETFEGDVERIGGALDPASRSLAVYVRVANADGRLRPNMRATLDLVTGGSDLTLAIPKTAVLGESGHAFVFVQDGERADRFARRAVVLGASDDRFVEVIDGLAPGERIVTSGNYSLQYVAPRAADDAEDAAAKTTPANNPSGETKHGERDQGGIVRWAIGALLIGVVLAAGTVALRRRGRGASEGH